MARPTDGTLATSPIDGAEYNYADAPFKILEKKGRIDNFCRRYGVPLAAAALQFPLGHPAVAASIPGAVHPSEVERNLAHLRSTVPADLWAELKSEDCSHPDAPMPG